MAKSCEKFVLCFRSLLAKYVATNPYVVPVLSHTRLEPVEKSCLVHLGTHARLGSLVLWKARYDIRTSREEAGGDNAIGRNATFDLLFLSHFLLKCCPTRDV